MYVFASANSRESRASHANGEGLRADECAIVIIVNPGHDVDDLKNAMAVKMEASPNCAEFMSKYRSKESKEMIVRPIPQSMSSKANEDRY